MSTAIRAAAAAALTLSLAMPIAAQAAAPNLAEAHASFTSLSFEVYDALPLDGLAPSIRFVDDAQRWRALTSYSVYDNATSTELAFLQDVTFGSTPTAFDRGIVSQPAGASTSSTIFKEVLLSADVWVQGSGMEANSYAGISSSRAGLERPVLYNLLLGAGTGVRLTAVATTSVSVDTRPVASPGGDGYQFAFASSQLLATFSAPTATGAFDEDNAQVQTAEVTRWLDGSGMIEQDGATQTLSISFENLGSAEQIGRVRFESTVYAITAVPEPGTAAMWAAGVALLGLVARGRKPGR